MISVLFSYSHKDENLRDQLELHLALLRRLGVISTWHDRRLVAGHDLDAGIRHELERADIILLLVSPNFLASDYCYGIEMTRALERHRQGTARVIPIILKSCDWKNAPFGTLLASPTDGRPVMNFANRDDAFLDITKAIRAAVDHLHAAKAAPKELESPDLRNRRLARSYPISEAQAHELIATQESLMIKILSMAVSNIMDEVAIVNWRDILPLTEGMSWKVFGQRYRTPLHKALRKIVGAKGASYMGQHVELLWEAPGWTPDQKGGWAAGELRIDGTAIGAVKGALARST